MIINNKVVSDDTEQNLVLAPASYWQLFVQPNLADVLRRKASRNRIVRSDDTKVVVSVTERSERDLKKTFKDTEIDWLIVEQCMLLFLVYAETSRINDPCLGFGDILHSNTMRTV